ncbi:MAG: hypothetical protein ACOX8W_03265 [bacterium]
MSRQAAEVAMRSGRLGGLDRRLAGIQTVRPLRADGRKDTEREIAMSLCLTLRKEHPASYSCALPGSCRNPGLFLYPQRQACVLTRSRCFPGDWAISP